MGEIEALSYSSMKNTHQDRRSNQLGISLKISDRAGRHQEKAAYKASPARIYIKSTKIFTIKLISIVTREISLLMK